MPCVKTAISMEESLFKEANELAGELQVSRSRLVAMALEEYLSRRRLRDLQERINEAYAEPLDEQEEAFVRASTASLAELTRDDKW